MRRLLANAAAVAAAFAFSSFSTDADAAGLYYSERGVRPLGRGGAFVAGADDLGAITYNPAGLADAGSALLLDLAWVNVTTNYTRRAVVNDAGGNATLIEFPKVQGTTPFLPIPTIAGSFSPSFENHMFTFALGVYAPYAALSTYPTTVGGQPAPSRYSLITMEGSVLAVLGAYVAFKPVEELRIGAGFEALAGSLETQQVFSASPQDRLLSAPESAEYDAAAKLKTKTFFAPSAHVGATVVPIKELRFGLAFHLPYHVNTPATLDVTLPRAATFDAARQEGNSVQVRTDLPATLRAGVEVRPIDALRLEVAYVREFWGIQKSLDITPNDLKFYGVTGFPSPFDIPPVSIPRNYHASNSFRFGAEYAAIRNPPKNFGLDLRAGVNYESSAIPRDYLTPLTADLDRLTLALGVSLRPHPKFRIDVLYAHVIGFERTVNPQTAGVAPVNPVRGNPTNPAPINGGTYDNHGDILGLGGTVKF